MVNRIVRNITIFLATVILGCLITNAYAGDEAQRERPSMLFSPSKIPLLEDIEFMKRIKSALKPHGKVAIMEFSDEGPVGPPLKIRLPESLVVNELKQAGFTLSQRHTFLLPYQYFLVFTPL